MQVHQGGKLAPLELDSGRSRSDHLGRSRRRWERTPLDANVQIWSPVAATGLALNISAGGVFVTVSRALREGQVCTLSLEGQPEMARVAWCKRVGTGCIAG
ncbi:MAG: PilZ domain-containing protein, partial [Deltaproteobacteria bacterium]|nr:PilZ domain-containing protein [Deltaproteobacteria bacterium]